MQYTKMKAIEEFLTGVKLAYIQDQKDKGLVASGKSAASLRVVMTNDMYGELFGADYFYYQIYGRGPGKFPPIEAIIEWLKSKHNFRVDNERDISLRSRAYLIARGIAHNGTLIHQGKKQGLNVQGAIDEGIIKLRETIAKDETAKVIDILTKTIKKI